MRADDPQFSTPHPVTVVVEGVAMAALTIGIYALGALTISKFFLERLASAQARGKQRKLMRRMAKHAPLISADRSLPPSSP